MSSLSTSSMASNNNNDRLTSRTRRRPKARLSRQKIRPNPIPSPPPPPPPPQVHDVNASPTASSSSPTVLSVTNVSPHDSVSMRYNLFDLNLPPPPEINQDYPSPAPNGVESVRECSPNGPEEKISGISVLQDKAETSNVANGMSPEKAAEGEELGETDEERRRRFAALLDVAEWESKNYYARKRAREPSKREERNGSDVVIWQRKKSKTGKKAKQQKEEEDAAMATAIAAAEEVSTSPVVKSYRGRIQVLPSRLRDSIMEPLKNQSSRQGRSSSRSGPTVRTRRRSRH